VVLIQARAGIGRLPGLASSDPAGVAFLDPWTGALIDTWFGPSP